MIQWEILKLLLNFIVSKRAAERWRRRKEDWRINAKLAGVDLREIRFDSEAVGGKIGIISQICGKYWVWKSERWKRERKKEGV